MTDTEKTNDKTIGESLADLSEETLVELIRNAEDTVKRFKESRPPETASSDLIAFTNALMIVSAIDIANNTHGENDVQPPVSGVLSFLFDTTITLAKALSASNPILSDFAPEVEEEPTEETKEE